MGLLEEMLQQQGVTPPGLMNQQVPEIPLQRMPQVPESMPIPPAVAPRQQETRKPMKEVISDFAGNFLFALSRAMAASAQAPGPRGSMMGTAAALETPMLMQQAQAQQQAENRKLQMELERLNLEKRRVDNDATNKSVQEQLAILNAGLAQQKEEREAKESEARIADLERKAKELTPLAPGASLADPTGKIVVTAPDRAQDQPNLQRVEIEDPDKPGKALVANFNPVTGKVMHPATGEVIPNPRPFQKPLVEINTGPTPYATERAARTIQSVNELLGQVSGWTTGFGSLLSNIPTTDARSFRAQLDTLKANIAFNELTAMREASKTGGALGQVSNIELQLLQSALGALDQALSPADVKKQLERVKGSVERWQAAVAKGWADGKTAPSAEDEAAEYLKKRGLK